MKIIVKKGYTAYYKNVFRKSGDVLEFQGEKCPAWANEIVEQKDKIVNCEKACNKFVVETPKSVVEEPQGQNIIEQTQNNIEKNEDTSELIQKLDELLDEAVAKNIEYLPKDNASLQEQINELTELLKDKK